jgi:hypothetical protein
MAADNSTPSSTPCLLLALSFLRLRRHADGPRVEFYAAKERYEQLRRTARACDDAAAPLVGFARSFTQTDSGHMPISGVAR